ncbi:phosphotransferase family protein [Nocardia nova]|uniref:phosphotransferase family protein n=1 Tax=Nocardia nova TaxID=37330 RepID=UPI001893BD9A|nr:phosphotransferase family protein [Nocardia nova]MBF6149556.1 phosphotransferase family protein [Nocardia nova]
MIGTEEERAERLRRWLSERAEVHGALKIERIGFGQSNITSLISDEEGTGWVLREPPPGTHDPSAHNVLREARILTALADTGIPLPTVIGTHEANPFYVMTRISGAPLESESDAEKLSPRQRAVLGQQVIEIFARLHSLEPAAVGLDDLGPDTDYLPRQMRRAARNWSQWGEHSAHEQIWRYVHSLLEADPPRQQRSVITHGDYRLSNLLVDSGRITAVLDWELATTGDPLADLAWLLDDWRGPQEPQIIMPSPTRAGGFPDRDDLIDMYCAATGFDADSIGYYRAFTHWRAATLLQGVLLRRRSGAMGEHGALDLVKLDTTIGYLLAEAAVFIHGGCFSSRRTIHGDRW